MRSVDEHQFLVAGLIRSPRPVARRLDEARGLALAEDYYAASPLPGFDNSAMDGYAVRASDVAGASADHPVTLPVVQDLPAGARATAPLEPGTAHRIMTGAPLPPGADTIVPVEASDGGTEIVVIREPSEPGRFIRPAGSDLAAGDLVLEAGTALGPAQLAVLTALGETTATVIPRLRVLVVTTGDELAVPGSGRLEPGQVYDANGPMLSAAVACAGGSAMRRLVVDDDASRFLLTLEAALGEVDLVLTSGGVSAGAYEVVREALGPCGVEFAKVAMQPGMPQGAGLFEGVPVVCLPGNPVSSLVSFEVFVRPALRTAMRLRPAHRPVVEAILAEDLTSARGKRQLRRARLDREAGRVTPWGPPASFHLARMAQADGLIDIPEGVSALTAGETVRVWDLRD